MTAVNLGDMSIYELFRLEVEGQALVLTDALLALEADTLPADQLRTCMRCMHSLKGAARMVGLTAGVSVAHAMEECLVASQQGRITLRHRQIDVLLLGVDLLKRIAHTLEADIGQWTDANASDAVAYLAALQQVINDKVAVNVAKDMQRPEAAVSTASTGNTQPPEGRMLRVTAENMNRLLGLAGESLVASRWLKPFVDSLMRLKRMQTESGKSIKDLEHLLSTQMLDENVLTALANAKQRIGESQQFLSQRLVELEVFARRESDLAQRLYDGALASRMRPFSDGVTAFPRMVRDLGHALGKQVTLVITGRATQVDRDILEKLEGPLTHLLRNAVDHGIETPDERRAAGKPAEAVLKLEATHSAGMLLITVSDDGCGIDTGRLRDRIIARQLASTETAAQLSEAELLEFLFLPGFTTKDDVSEISGRGVGLNIVQHMVKQVRGRVHVDTRVRQGTHFRLQLPLTTSVVRALLVAIGGEPYAFPLASISRTLLLRKENIEYLEGHQYFHHNGQMIGLVTAHQVLEAVAPRFADELPVIVVGDAARPYGVIVDSLLGEHQLAAQTLDARLGKIKDISAAALMEDGSPVLIIDIEDMIHSIDKLIAAGPLDKAQGGGSGAVEKKCKRVLVVDDSLTVRELERKLLLNRGYEVEVAVDGMDGWNAARIGHFDLIITDIDMPRMDGIELVTLIKQHPKLRSVPVVIVSYKDREEDRRLGLEAGADYYLTKGGFHDERLIGAVVDLIGEASA
jgi:two-component system, chemotaxis family, sensor histidine kinase and response regulator WspE